MTDPFDDVYQAGLWMHLEDTTYFRNDSVSKLYRGQRSAKWINTASLFRPGALTAELRRERLQSLAGTLARRLGLDRRHAFAACQHYADMARLDGDSDGSGAISTWLLDVTWNPFIALAFASHGSLDGDIGVVAVLSRPEWTDSAGSVAPLDLVELDLRRPRQQEAGFIDSQYPELLEDYIPYRLYFRQFAGWEFDDKTMGASRTNIYPVGDPVCAVVREWAEEEKSLGHPPDTLPRLELPDRALRPVPARAGWVGPDVYLEICGRSLEELDPSGIVKGLNDFGETSDPNVRRGHLELLAVFHSWARVLKPEMDRRLSRWSPGLGALLNGAWVAHLRAGRQNPVDLAALTDQYDGLEHTGRHKLIGWIQSRWHMSPTERGALWNGTTDPDEFLGSLD